MHRGQRLPCRSRCLERLNVDEARGSQEVRRHASWYERVRTRIDSRRARAKRVIAGGRRYKQWIGCQVGCSRESALHDRPTHVVRSSARIDLIGGSGAGWSAVTPEDTVGSVERASGCGVHAAGHGCGNIASKRAVARIHHAVRNADPNCSAATSARRAIASKQTVGVRGVAAAVRFHATGARRGVVAEDAASECARHSVGVECTTVTAAVIVIELAVGKGCLRGEDVARATTEGAAVRSKDAIANGWCTARDNQDAAALVLIARTGAVGVAGAHRESVQDGGDRCAGTRTTW